MLLRQLHLHNLRSYTDQTITFPRGSCLLSGDIGSGKSTILLAIEFALFGASRTDLPAESLLRKGTTQGSAELTFLLEGKEITIRRGLKKEKDSIKQIAGHIIINDLKRELTPLEMKAEMLQLLGYPEEFLTKTKNYLFQYTVYTPQEEMKSILQENAEIRLDTLRKIFNLDQYKTIRENTQSYLRYLREQMRILETRIEPGEELRQRQQKLHDEKTAVQEALQLLAPKLEEVKVKVQESQQRLDFLEEEQRLFQELAQQHATLQAILQEKQTRWQQLRQQQEVLQQENSILAIPEGISTEQVAREQKELQQQRQDLLAQSTILREQAAGLHSRIQEMAQDLERVAKIIEVIPEKQQLAAQLREELTFQPTLQEKKMQLEESLLKANEDITKSETLLSQSQEIMNTILTLENCPLCLQAVSSGHKHTIAGQEGEKMRQAELSRAEFQDRKKQLVQEGTALQERLDTLSKKELQLARMQLELGQLQEQRSLAEKKKGQLRGWQEEQQKAERELQQLRGEETLAAFTVRLQQLQALQEIITKKQFLARRLDEGEMQITALRSQISPLVDEIGKVRQQLPEKKDRAAAIKEVKDMLTQHLYLEKSLEVQQGQLQTKQILAEQQLRQLAEALEKIQQHQLELQQRKEIHHWLDEFFLNLTYTLEKHILRAIHALFNQLFQEWFSILIDDEGVFSRIDDTFYPIIEQNGYEIPFVMLSGGEKTSASLAYRLALNRVINDVIHQIKTKDLLILDEPTDGFSSEQLDKVREVLERLHLAQTIMVSHESKIESFVEKIIRIRKEGQVSEVVTE